MIELRKPVTECRLFFVPEKTRLIDTTGEPLRPRAERSAWSRRSQLAGASVDSSDSFVLKNPHNDSTILSFRIIRFTRVYLPALAHRAGSQHSRERDIALLLQVVSHIISAVFAQ